MKSSILLFKNKVRVSALYQPLSWWHKDQGRPISGWLLSGCFEGNDEPGDPSGLFLIVCGWVLECYWPMHMPFYFTFGLEKPHFLFRRW